MSGRYFVLTDYKPQSRTMSRVLLGRRSGEDVDACETISLYVQMWDWKKHVCSNRLILGNERLKRAADKTTEAFIARHAR